MTSKEAIRSSKPYQTPEHLVKGKMKMTDISSKAVQHGLERQMTGKMQSLWLELPGYCNLACSYCYAEGGCPKTPENLLSWEHYESLLEQAKEMGVDSVGIPGAGEPFDPRNRELTMKILQKCAELGMYVTLFTTGHLISEKLAREIYELPVELMIKGNSLDPATQDRFVSNPALGGKKGIRRGYGRRRNESIEMLMRLGFNDEANCQKKFGRKSRMALVTSIMTSEDTKEGPSNYDEMVEILRFCRKHNIIFDCDSVLKVGRGTTTRLYVCDEELRQKLQEIQRIDREEFQNFWEVSQSYVGTVCDRYMHHMYVDQYGTIRPCIGATGVNLGNIRSITLAHAWESVEMKVIRARNYGGVCGTNCQNFAEGKCNSCLGRRAANLTNEFLCTRGIVDTIGCWNNRPIKGGEQP